MSIPQRMRVTPGLQDDSERVLIMSGISTLSVTIEGKYYRVMPYPYDEIEQKGPDILRKGIAYQVKTSLTKGLFPYRGIVGRKAHINRARDRVGLYMKEITPGRYEPRFVRPRTKKERQEYALGRERDIAHGIVEGKIDKSLLLDLDMVPTGGTGDAFLPPIRTEDDPLNRLMKLAIRLKNAPFGPYGKRLEALAVDRSSIEGSNIKNNAKRAILNNTAMSPTKCIMYADSYEFELAFIIRDVPGAANPMFEDGKMLVLFPSGPAFEIDPAMLVDSRELILDAIHESKASDGHKLKKEKKKKQIPDRIPKHLLRAS